jgi:ELWxxDGT repeat protein
VIFTADDGEHGREIWRTRGTRATTRMVRDVVPGPDPFSPYQFTRFGDQVFMQGDDGAHGAEPWATDGTKKGTRLLRDINPAGSAMAYYSGPTRFGKRVVFTAAATPGDDELWVTNGKPEGTRTFELNPTGPSLPHAFASVGRTLYFTADDGTSGDEPWIWRP